MASEPKHMELRNVKPLEYSVREAMNTLKTNIYFSGKVKTISVFSAIPGEGKSTVSFNLARIIAEEGKIVVFVDSDMRKSNFIGKYKPETIGTLYGLTHYLSGQADLIDIIYMTNIPKLNVVTIGPLTPSPIELINDQRHEEMLQMFARYFDYVIIDCPPLGSVIDAAVISSHCDGAILVIEAGEVSRKHLVDVKDQFEASAAEFWGPCSTRSISARRVTDTTTKTDLSNINENYESKIII